MKLYHFVKVFIMLFIISVKADIPKSIDTDSRSRWVQLEHSLKNPQLQLEKKKEIAHKLAEEYLSDQRLQEAIWILRENGNPEQAEVLEQQLADKLSHDQFTVIHKFVGSKEGACLVQIQGSNIYGVIKSNSEYFGFELAAYKLDRILKLNLVPLTIDRSLPDGRKISIQYFIRDAVDAYDSLGIVGWRTQEQKKETEFRYYGYPNSQKKMWLLDYLIGNVDRHGSNWLWHLGEQNLRPIAIDHGISFDKPVSKKGVDFESGNLPDNETEQILRQLTLKRLKTEFSNLIGVDNVLELFKRKIKIIRATKTKSKLSCHSLFL